MRDTRQIGRAAPWTPSWRADPFEIGATYRVLRASAPLPASEATCPGELVTYQGSGYSRYDGCGIYAFVTSSGEDRSWWLHDDDPLASAWTFFEQVDRARGVD